MPLTSDNCTAQNWAIKLESDKVTEITLNLLRIPYMPCKSSVSIASGNVLMKSKQILY